MTTAMTGASLSPIVSRREWQSALASLLLKEKAATQACDALNAERRRLSMVEIEQEYRFTGPEGEVGLIDLFAGRRQLVISHFMFGLGGAKGARGAR